MLRQTTIRMGENRGKPRVYMKGKWLGRAGFTPGRPIDVEFGAGSVTIRLTPTGHRRVCGRTGESVPVIDVENAALATALASAERLQVTCAEHTITITPAYAELLVRGRVDNDRAGSLFSGGGLLDEAARQAGFAPTFGVEIDPDYAAIFEANHPGAAVFNSCVSEVAFEQLARFRPLGLLTGGICCEPFTGVRRLDRVTGAKRDKSLPAEAHELGDMTFWMLRAIEATNPHTVVCEEVPAYLDSASWWTFQHVARRLGYTVEGRVLDALDFGELTDRKRAVVVCTTGRPIAWPVPEAIRLGRTLREILDPPPCVYDWFNAETKPWLFDHWAKQTARGNGFASQVVTAESRSVGTIKKRYFAQQGDNPVVGHPTMPGVYRWLTLSEVRRLHGVPDHYDLGPAVTTAGEVIGQGVIVPLFRRVIESVTGRAVKATRDGEGVRVA